LIGTYNVATTNDISTAINNLVSSAPSTLDTLNELATALGNDANFSTTMTTQLATKANNNSVVHLSGNETITGQKTFNNNLIVGSSYNLQVSTLILNGTDLITTLGNYVLSSSLTSTLASYVTSSSLTSTLASYVTSSSLTSTLASYITSSSLTSTLSSYLTTNTAQTITATKTVSRLSENITSASITSNVLTLDFSSNNSVVYCSPSANFTVAFTNIPTTNQTQTYTFTIIANAKFYGNAITVNGTSYTAIAIGGLSNISINASATYVMQTITIMFISSTTPTKIITSVSSLF